MKQVTIGLMSLAMLLSAAIFGFFYAWICSTMWAFDAMDPRVAIEAMQGMNASVRNGVFAPAFFGTPLAMWAAALALRSLGARGAAVWFALGGAVYFAGGLVLTMLVNVPMNEALALVAVPADEAAAQAIWQGYSAPWQVWNITRTVLSGVAFGMGLVGVFRFAAQKG